MKNTKDIKLKGLMGMLDQKINTLKMLEKMPVDSVFKIYFISILPPSKLQTSGDLFDNLLNFFVIPIQVRGVNIPFVHLQ